LAISEGDQAVIGDGHAMGVAAQIVQHIFGTTKGTFQVDHPVLPVQWPQLGSEDLGLRKKLKVSLEVALAILESLLKSVDELAGNPEIRTNSEACISILLSAGDLPHSLP